MKQFAQKAFQAFTSYRKPAAIAAFIIFILSSGVAAQQAVSGVITDYQGFWKTRTGAYNSVKPVNNHNLLAFTYNTRTYSTGVNDAALNSAGESFIPGDFWSLPIDNISGTPNSNTKVGLGEMFDGVHNGAGTVPSNDIKGYLTDGIKGLNIGSCIANLPSGDLTFFINNINPALIGDGIPDVVVTQVADPSSTYDRYSFIDNNGAIVGTSRDIIFTNISPVGNWTADFWEASRNPMVLGGGFTNTDRAIRLWAADLSEFGITAANYQQIRKFKIHLSGDSDVAFVAYNRTTISLTVVLPVSLNDFTAKTKNNNTVLNWNTSSEENSARFIIEKKENNGLFVAIDSVAAMGNSNVLNYYSTTDKNVKPGNSYYRLKMIDRDGRSAYSRIILVTTGTTASIDLSVYPNPATDKITVDFPSAPGSSLGIYSSTGVLANRVSLAGSDTQATVNISNLKDGIYYIVWESAGNRISKSFVVK